MLMVVRKPGGILPLTHSPRLIFLNINTACFHVHRCHLWHLTNLMHLVANVHENLMYSKEQSFDEERKNDFNVPLERVIIKCKKVRNGCDSVINIYTVNKGELLLWLELAISISRMRFLFLWFIHLRVYTLVCLYTCVFIHLRVIHWFYTYELINVFGGIRHYLLILAFPCSFACSPDFSFTVKWNHETDKTPKQYLKCVLIWCLLYYILLEEIV